MAKKLLLLSLFMSFNLTLLFSATIKGVITFDDKPISFATVVLNNGEYVTQSDTSGLFQFLDVSPNDYKLDVSKIGFLEYKKVIQVINPDQNIELEISLVEDLILIDDIVVTGTKTFKRKTDSPVIVNVLSSQTMNEVQACNVSEGLKFQPGLRIETDCQTCNYTQLRINGLAGGYSQILINGRPIFSPLTGLYGLEQLPVNMVDKIEVVKGGGSSLYGSSAVGGTVNILTKIPTKNDYSVAYNYQLINGAAWDHQINANTNLVTKNKKSGVSLFFNSRNREIYDHNEDNYSELPSLENRSFGANFFSRPTDNQKIELSLSNLNEYRYGGEIGIYPAHLAGQSEERTHNVWMGSADYQLNFNDGKSSLITYLAWQNTKRAHYTGIQPDDTEELVTFLENPPYGISNVSTYNAGFQLNHEIESFFVGSNVLTFGGEYVFDKVFDEIPAYNYLIDQTTQNTGLFIQSDWEFSSKWNLLSGIRADRHNFVESTVISPRVSLLFKPFAMTQFRINYAKGFRAPQAFDADLHIAFAGGGISRVSLSSDLEQENSHSWSASMNYDKVNDDYIFGYTLEGFYTRLEDAFILESVGEDEFGEVFEKKNGAGASVQGLTLELRANYKRKIQLESGFTLQQSRNDESVIYIDGIQGTRNFIRTPNNYGFSTLSLNPYKKISVNINYVYTGKMLVPHFAGAENQEVDEIFESEAFSELSMRGSYKIGLPAVKSNLELFGGIKNILNSYQDDFDIGKNRDSNFVYGASMPRTIFIGVRLSGS